jgi:hypothetical protein
LAIFSSGHVKGTCFPLALSHCEAGRDAASRRRNVTGELAILTFPILVAVVRAFTNTRPRKLKFVNVVAKRAV